MRFAVRAGRGQVVEDASPSLEDIFVALRPGRTGHGGGELDHAIPGTAIAYFIWARNRRVSCAARPAWRRWPWFIRCCSDTAAHWEL